MVQDLVINLPQDHLKHMKVFLNHRILSGKDADRVIILVSPELDIGMWTLTLDIIVVSVNPKILLSLYHCRSEC